MAKKPSKGKKTGTVVTLMRTRLTTIQSKDEFLTAPLGLQIGQGGASHLYELKPTLQSRRVAKIYKDDYRADKGINAATKLIAMAGRHHELTSRLPFVLWPDELVLSSRAMTLSAVADAVLGFTMPPLPDNTINLYTLLKQPNARIINISSVIGLMGNAGQANYAASKAGLIGLTKSLAKEFAGRGVCVNAVAPGFIVTDMTNELNEQQQEAIKKQIPLGTLGQVDDISAAVMYLAGPGGRYVTGQVLVVDGGMVM